MQNSKVKTDEKIHKIFRKNIIEVLENKEKVMEIEKCIFKIEDLQIG